MAILHRIGLAAVAVALRHAVVLALLPSVAAAGQTQPAMDKPPTTTRVSRAVAEKIVEEWTQAVRTHTAGTLDPPLETIAKWSPEWAALAVRLVVERLGRLVEARSVALTQDVEHQTGTLLQGLSLHTDIALSERDAEAPAGRPGAVVLVDGQVTRSLLRSAHWPFARQLAAALATRLPQRPRVVAWYRATAALMQGFRDVDLLAKHLEAGQTLFLDDPVLALYQGTLRQTFGDPRLQDYLARRGSTEGFGLPPEASRRDIAAKAASLDSRIVLGAPSRARDGLPDTSKIELRVAERELRRALTLDPDLHEARIRLAHVLGRLGDDRQVVALLQPALEAPLSPFLEFYAALLVGRSEEQLGHFAEAGLAYQRAAARFPGAQSAEIGRSRVALAQGRPADAVQILLHVAGPHETERADPWLEYLQSHDLDGEAMIRAWREDLP
jgi:hypothetical protein